jgi:hypothetical protein
MIAAASTAMAQPAVLVAGLLLVAQSQASNLADRSAPQGFLSKHTPCGSDGGTKSSGSAPFRCWEEQGKVRCCGHDPNYGKFIIPSPNQVQDSMAFAAARARSEISTKDLNQPMSADREQHEAVQKVLANDSSFPITLSAIGVGLLSLLTMLGVRMRRGLQQSFVVTSSGDLGPDMPINTTSVLGDKVMEMKSQDSDIAFATMPARKVNSSRSCWGQLSSPSAQRSTRCYAKSQALPWLDAPAHLADLPGNADFDPLGLSLASPSLLQYYREAELKHGRLAMLAAIGWPASELWDPPLADMFGLDVALTPEFEAPSVLNGGLLGISPVYWGATLGFATAVELFGLSLRMAESDESLAPGDLGFDPLDLYPAKTSERRRMSEAEVKHGRLAMIAVVGYAAEEYLLGTPVIEHSSGFFEPFWAHLFD